MKEKRSTQVERIRQEETVTLLKRWEKKTSYLIFCIAVLRVDDSEEIVSSVKSKKLFLSSFLHSYGVQIESF